MGANVFAKPRRARGSCRRTSSKAIVPFPSGAWGRSGFVAKQMCTAASRGGAAGGDEEDLEDFLDDEEDGFMEDMPDEMVDRVVDPGDSEWGQKILTEAQDVLKGPEFTGIELYLFRANSCTQSLDVRLDKLDNKYGSPEVDELAAFSRALMERATAVLGEEAVAQLEVEVSSPGAERAVLVPDELSRFQDLPMKVEYWLDEERSRPKVQILQPLFTCEESQVVTWGLADVRVNRTDPKRQRLTRKQREQEIAIPIAQIKSVNLYLDV